MQSRSGLWMVVIAILSAYVFAAASFSVERNHREQEKAFQERIEQLKKQGGCLYFEESNLSASQQESLAKKILEEIKAMSEVKGFDSVDHQGIFARIQKILREAPQTDAAKVAHWRIHVYFMSLLEKPDREQARIALETFLFKYGDKVNNFIRKQAYDKLSLLAKKAANWGRMLYYVDKYLALDPESLALRLSRARALTELGAPADAREILEKIVREAPGTVQYNLAMDLLDRINGDGKQGGNELNAYLKSIASIREVAKNLEIYHLDNMKLPADLSKLVPEFVDEIPMDAWGHALHYRVSDDGSTYFIGSGGSDGRFEGFDQQGTYSQPNGRDIIFSDGGFTLTLDRKN